MRREEGIALHERMPLCSFELRRLGSPDVPLMRQLNTLFGDAFAEPDTYTAEPPTTPISRTCSGPSIALVALAGEEVLGGLVAYELESSRGCGGRSISTTLPLPQSTRRRRIATMLIKRLREIAAERGAWVVYVQADYGDDPAITLYEKLAGREEVLHFDIPVAR